VLRKTAQKVTFGLVVGVLTFGPATAAFAGGSCSGGGKVKCNSGRGNGSETTIANDCDPGNSGGHNNGGD